MFTKLLKIGAWIVGTVVLIAALVRPFIIKPPFTPVKEVEPVVVEPEPEPPEEPLHNVDLPDFGKITDIRTKKKAFFDFISPSIEKANSVIMAEKAVLAEIIKDYDMTQVLADEHTQQLGQLNKRYRVSSRLPVDQQLAALKLRVDVIPDALVLVQAANESAWGTSRFARIGLNFFGIWCYSKGCGMVPRARNEGADHEVEAFQSVNDAVTRYLNNLNTNAAYENLRAIRANLRAYEQPLSPEVLATGLVSYSERGNDYIMEINDMLRHNQSYFPPVEQPAEPLIDEVVKEQPAALQIQ